MVCVGSSVHGHADTPAGLLADEEVLQIALRGSEGDVEGVGGEGAAAEELCGTLRGVERGTPEDSISQSPPARTGGIASEVCCHMATRLQRQGPESAISPSRVGEGDQRQLNHIRETKGNRLNFQN